MPKKNIPIDYLARDYQTIKNALVEHAKKYYPETYKDFSEVGFGSLMLDTVAYVGDNLSFYLDYSANESFLDTATEFDNILKLSKPFGFKYSENPSSHGIASFFILVPSNLIGTGPDSSYMPVLKKNSTFNSVNGVAFTLIEDPADIYAILGLQVTDTKNAKFRGNKAYDLKINKTMMCYATNIDSTKSFAKVSIATDKIIGNLGLILRPFVNRLTYIDFYFVNENGRPYWQEYNNFNFTIIIKGVVSEKEKDKMLEQHMSHQSTQ